MVLEHRALIRTVPILRHNSTATEPVASPVTEGKIF